MKVEFAAPVNAVATEALACAVCHNGNNIAVGADYIQWDATFDGMEVRSAIHVGCSPLTKPDGEDYGTHGTIKRADMTDDGDFHDYFCDNEGCSNAMGCNGPHPYVSTDEGDVLCFTCAIQAGITEYTLDPETCYMAQPEGVKALFVSTPDTLRTLIRDGVWHDAYFPGGKIGESLPSYKVFSDRWFGRNGAKPWDENELGPYWQFADTYCRPWNRASFRSIWAVLFPNQPDPEGPCPLTQRT